MNEKFYALPEEKQSQILNAAYKVFAMNQYKKAPTSEIAAEAGISKSLLFHYFHNKLELYLFLWKHAADLTKKYMCKYNRQAENYVSIFTGTYSRSQAF